MNRTRRTAVYMAIGTVIGWLVVSVVVPFAIRVPSTQAFVDAFWFLETGGAVGGAICGAVLGLSGDGKTAPNPHSYGCVSVNDGANTSGAQLASKSD